MSGYYYWFEIIYNDGRLVIDVIGRKAKDILELKTMAIHSLEHYGYQ